MMFCLLIEIIILLFIGIDVFKLIKKKKNKYINYFEIILVGVFFLLIVYIFLSEKEHEVLLWINNNSLFYLIYLLSAIVMALLNIILYFKN